MKNIIPLSNRFITLIGHQLDSNDQSSNIKAVPSSAPKAISLVINQLTSPSRSLLKLEGSIQGKSAIILVDSGATGEFISSSFVKDHGIKSSPLPQQDFDVEYGGRCCEGTRLSR